MSWEGKKMKRNIGNLLNVVEEGAFNFLWNSFVLVAARWFFRSHLKDGLAKCEYIAAEASWGALRVPEY